jgi:hypothetical protein
LAILLALALAPSSALGSPEHPQLNEGGVKKPGGRKVPVIGWGTLKLSNRTIGSAECAMTLTDDVFNATEPAASTERAYGEVLVWSATSFMNTSGGELSARCRSSSGFNLYAVAEPAPELSTEMARVGGQERLVIKGVRRSNPALPWRQEAEGTEGAASEKTFWLKTGIATSGREAVEAEEAAAGVPTESRSGCYPNPPVTEVLRTPGFLSERETELTLRPAPQGCVRVTVMWPELGLEMPVQGTLEPEVVNGVRNGLSPSSATFKGGFIGPETEVPSERSSERNARHMESSIGPWYVKSPIPTKGLGFLHEELLQLK